MTLHLSNISWISLSFFNSAQTLFDWLSTSAEKSSASPGTYPVLYEQTAEWNKQRVLNDLERTMLSCARMIRILAHPFTLLSRQQVVSLSQSSCVSLVEFTDGSEGGEGRGWARS